MARHWRKQFPKRPQRALYIEPDCYEYEDPDGQDPLGAARGCLLTTVCGIGIWIGIAVVAALAYRWSQ